MAYTSTRIKIDKTIQMLATNTLEDLGTTPAELYRILMKRIVKERKIPFDIRVPNAETCEAIREIEEGREEGVRFGTIEELMADLNAES